MNAKCYRIMADGATWAENLDEDQVRACIEYFENESPCVVRVWEVFDVNGCDVTEAFYE